MTGKGTTSEKLFMGIGAEGVVYCDRSREIDGDYARVAYYAFGTPDYVLDINENVKLSPDADPELARMAAQHVMRMCRNARRLKISVRQLCREFSPVHCCECEEYIDHVQNETHGAICTATMCEKCHGEYIQELSENGVKI